MKPHRCRAQLTTAASGWEVSFPSHPPWNPKSHEMWHKGATTVRMDRPLCTPSDLSFEIPVSILTSCSSVLHSIKNWNHEHLLWTHTHTQKMSTRIQSKEPISSAHEFNQATTIHCGQSSLHEQWPTWGRDVDLFISCSLDARPWRCLWQWSILQLRQQLCKGCLANKLFPAQVCQHGRKQGRKWYKIAEIYCNNKWIVYDVH